ncbi:MAG: hypothetical protein IIA48_10925 [Bacteroidetes bacterium]|nr:hypothetical protein [Bacteroidota bacterium]
MKNKLTLIKYIVTYAILGLVVFIAGCTDSVNAPEINTSSTTDPQVFKTLAEQDSTLASFEPNYNEQDAMSFLGKTLTDIYPLRVGQKMRLVSKEYEVNEVGDTAYVKVIKTFEGVLYIKASYSPPDSNTQVADTLIEKPFSTVITRNLIFAKKQIGDIPLNNWRLVAVSLPEGGTLTDNINITKLTITLANGDQMIITSPNDYYLTRGIPIWKQIPVMARHEEVTLEVEITSIYADTGFVTLTYGGNRQGMHRAKKIFELISSVQNGSVYNKVYQQKYTTHQFPGHFHAIINAFPKQVIYDDVAPVEVKTWGIPYIVKPN